MKTSHLIKIYLPLGILIVGILYFSNIKPFQKHIKPSPPISHIPRITQIGPFGQQVELAEKIGDLLIKLKIKHIFFKKSNVLVFKCSLFKKLIAQDLELIIFKKGKKLLALRKNKQILYSNLNHICIDHPHIIYPSTILPPEKIVIDKSKSKIVFYYKNKTKNFSELIN